MSFDVTTEELQAAVDLALRKPEYVDTGDLINALGLALAMLSERGVVVIFPDHLEETCDD